MGKRFSGSKVIFSGDLKNDLKPLLASHGKIFLVTEETVCRLWIEQGAIWGGIPRVVLPPGEENKKLSSVAAVWEFLSQGDADRTSLLINVGGGMITDLGGFAASTFKRGIDFINIPTTLLAQVDASSGGKTGFNFRGLKNEIGTFTEPRAVIIHSLFLKTLDRENILSGYAEMIKHGLIFSPDHLAELQAFDAGDIDFGRLQEMIRHSVVIKEHFITRDPTEKNIRKALNFGHTTGHALESLALEQERPVLHGYAVAWGMVVGLYLSSVTCGFPADESDRISRWIKKRYGQPPLERSHYDKLYERMQHDKKNEPGRINFTLLPDTGRYKINQECPRETIFDALEYLKNI